MKILNLTSVLVLLLKNRLAIVSSKFEPHYEHTYHNSYKLQGTNTWKRTLTLEGAFTFYTRDYSFSTCTKFSEKLTLKITFLNISFLENFAFAIIEIPLLGQTFSLSQQQVLHVTWTCVLLEL